MRTRRYEPEVLQSIANYSVNDAQKITLAKLRENGFTVVKVLTNDKGSAINVAAGTTSGWVTLDGKFHRPAKGKKHVAVSRTTLERIW